MQRFPKHIPPPPPTSAIKKHKTWEETLTENIQPRQITLLARENKTPRLPCLLPRKPFQVVCTGNKKSDKEEGGGLIEQEGAIHQCGREKMGEEEKERTCHTDANDMQSIIFPFLLCLD